MPNVWTDRQRGMSSATPGERRPISPLNRRNPRAQTISMAERASPAEISPHPGVH